MIPNYGGNPPGTLENVTRDINNPSYNANIAGDFVTDTPACFRGSEFNFCHLIPQPNGNCVITYDYIPHSDITDNSSEHVMFENIDILNFMSLLQKDANIMHFTSGQGVRMRETIAISSLNFDAVSTTLASLYEPYKIDTIETISNDIHSLTDNGDGTAEVCRLKSFTLNHYFQPGFDYEFYQGNTTNTTHQVDKYALYGILDEGILRYVNINQINPFFLTNQFDDYITSLSDIPNGVIFYEPIPCMRPVDVCVTEPYDNGKVTSKTNLASPNVTIKTLNSQEASDPNLEQNLENGKYHIIEKTTTSGAKLQKTIYKDGN